MPLTFNQDPCQDIDNSYRDNNVFKRSVLRILCQLVPSVGTLLGKVGLIDSTGADITATNPLPVTGTVTLPAGLATEATLASIDAKITACDTTNVTITAMPAVALPPGMATEATLASIDAKITACDTGAIAGSVSITDGIATATVRDLAANDALNVAIVDGAGAHITSFGGGTQYADGAVRGTATGTIAMGDDGINIQSLKCDANGVLAIQDNGGNITVDGSVSVSNAAGASAVNIQDGGNTITVDGSVSVSNAAGASAVNIQDGGNSITVDGSVTVSSIPAITGTVAISQVTPGTTNAVVIKDTTGVELDFRQENENWNAADHGILIFGRDTDSVPNKYRALNLNAEGDLHCDLSDINGVEPSVNNGTVDAGTLRVTIASNSTGVVGVNNAAGASAVNIQDGGNSITVDGSVSVTGTVTANAGTNLNTSTLAIETGGNLAAAATSLAVIDDWDDTDRCKVNPISGQVGVQGGSGAVTALTQRVVLATDVALPAGTNAIGKLSSNSGVDIGDVDILTMPSVAQATAANLNAQVVGNVAHDAADSGNPVKIGAIARTANPTAATATRRTDIFADDVGRLVVQPMQCRDLVGIQTTTITSSSAETTVVTQIGSTFCDITSITISTATATAHTATLKDSTGGTTRAIFAIAANGGVTVNYTTPMPQATVNNNWTITLSSNAVTDYINIVYVKNV